MMIFEEITKSLFTSDLFIQSGNNHKADISKDQSENMINCIENLAYLQANSQYERLQIDLSNLIQEWYMQCMEVV